jgi:hypothetical protein
VAFADEVKFTENMANIQLGDGLWMTASGGPTEFQVYAADPVAQQVACLVMMKENNNRDILFGARLGLRRGKIYEIEATGISLPYGTKTGREQKRQITH